jgi:arylsulfatase A-like enzyme
MTRRSFLAGSTLAAAAQAQHTNVVLILTDNQGAWTLGCYGNPEIRTPNIDRLASEGMLFSRAFSNNAVCSPTRASLLTGLMPSQHGVHTYLGPGGVQVGPNAYYTLREFQTLPRMLSAAGYQTGLSGKWHLGDNLHPQENCSLWITKPHGNSVGFYDQEVIEDGRIRIEPGYLTDLWTDRATGFIEKNRERPFFLYLAYNGPYGLGGAAKEPARNRHAAYYADKEFPSMPRDTSHPWQFNNREFMGSVAARRKYAAEISGIDDGVGRVMDTLRRLNLERNTLVIFMADQGLACGHSGFWGMGDHTRPLTAFDWGMSIPMIFRHPDRIPAGRKSDVLVSTYDVMPTVMHHLGMESRLPSSPRLPGRNFAPALAGKAGQWDNAVFYEFENVRAVRTAEWKYIERIHQGPNELYDLKKDPGERLNVIGAGAPPELRARLRDFFDRYADPKWDLWKGGRSKANLLTSSLFGLPNPERR